jgi:hypothetical protein
MQNNSMVSPGSKGWIKKYFNLIEKNQIDIAISIPENETIETYIHAAIGRTGLIFGYPTRLHFGKQLDDSKWTSEEKLTLILFEAHLLVYLVNKQDRPFDSNDFIDQLVAFYGKHSSYSISKLFTFFLKDTKEESIESILSKRVEIKMNLLENRFWVNYLSNVFNYFDVILFHQFLIDQNEHDFAKFDEMALNALTAITMASYADGEVDQKEKAIFDVCLASANLTDKDREHIQAIFEKGADFSDFTSNLKHNSLLKRYILDISTFVIFSNSDAHNEEVDFIHKLCLYFNFDLVEKNNAYALTEQFILSNQDKIPFLNENSTLEKIYSRFSKRWIKILGRNKDKLALEVKQSKELVYLIRKSTTKELTKEEKELVKTQFKDIVRSMPSLAIFMLPGGAFLLPLVLKIIPDLIPSAFRENEVED